MLDIRAGFSTAVGSRPRNEDFAAAARLLLGGEVCVVAAIADGVGGAAGGDVAAEIAVRGFIDGIDGQAPLLGTRAAASCSLEAIHRWLQTIGRTDASLAGMACTFTALILRGRQAHLVHVGDTRAYRLRDDALDRLTTDHALTGAGRRHMLTRAVGAPDLDPA